MYQKDFILRMIEMLAVLIAGILAKIKKGYFPEAAQSLDAAYSEFLKQEAAFFRTIPTEELIAKLMLEHKFTNGHIEILSELFFADAELLYAQNKKTESIEFYEKALLLFEFIDEKTKLFSIQKQSKISTIRARIDQLKV